MIFWGVKIEVKGRVRVLMGHSMLPPPTPVVIPPPVAQKKRGEVQENREVGILLWITSQNFLHRLRCHKKIPPGVGGRTKTWRDLPSFLVICTLHPLSPGHDT